MTDVNRFIRTYDHSVDAWTKRGDAADFAAFLAAELGISPKGVTVDKDGKTFRVYIPLVFAYWAPPSASPDAWASYLARMKLKVKQWAST